MVFNASLEYIWYYRHTVLIIGLAFRGPPIPPSPSSDELLALGLYSKERERKMLYVCVIALIKLYLTVKPHTLYLETFAGETFRKFHSITISIFLCCR